MGESSIESPRILVVTNNYPSRDLPHVGTFVAALVDAWAAEGVEVGVASPMPYWSATTGAVVTRDEGSLQDEPTVLRPPFLSFSNVTLVPGLSTTQLSLWSFRRALMQCMPRVPFAPDVLYAHFLFPAAYAALHLGAKLGVPVVGALGEADFGERERQVGFRKAAATARSLDAVVSVSRANADYCSERYGVDPDRITVVPNAIDPDRFRQLDREAARAQLGLPTDRPIVAFLGSLIDRKGPLRVLEAISALPDVSAVFLGAGPEVPEGKRVLFAGPVAHDEVALWLSAANLFVLPTIAEGSPNSVLEAMACGLPVVSGDIPALRETVTEEAATLVDPMDIEALREAIRPIVEDPATAARMSAAALALSAQRSLPARAARIRALLSAVVERHVSERG